MSPGLFDDLDGAGEEEMRPHHLGLGVVVWKDAFLDPNTRAIAEVREIDARGLTLATAGWLFEDDDGIVVVQDYMGQDDRARHSKRIRRCDIVQVVRAQISFTMDGEGDVMFAAAPARGRRGRPIGYVDIYEPWSVDAQLARLFDSVA